MKEDSFLWRNSTPDIKERRHKMFIPVKVEPEVGEAAVGYSLPYLQGNNPTIDYVQGIITKVDKESKELKVMEYKKLIPFNRIMVFTFGGIEIENTDYDEEERYRQDRKIIDNLQGIKRKY